MHSTSEFQFQIKNSKKQTSLKFCTMLGKRHDITTIRIVIVLLILCLNIGKCITERGVKSGFAQEDLSEHQETTLRRSRSGKSMKQHLRMLKQVNGLKRHNIFNTHKDIGPIIYINNPVEADLPNAYLNVEEFKKKLMDRALRLRPENQTTVLFYTGETKPTRTINRGRIDLKHYTRQIKPAATKVSPTVRLRSKIKKSSQIINITHLNVKRLKSKVTKARPTIRVRSKIKKGGQIINITQLHKELLKSHVKITYKDIKLPAVPISHIVIHHNNKENTKNNQKGSKSKIHSHLNKNISSGKPSIVHKTSSSINNNFTKKKLHFAKIYLKVSDINTDGKDKSSKHILKHENARQSKLAQSNKADSVSATVHKTSSLTATKTEQSSVTPITIKEFDVRARESSIITIAIERSIFITTKAKEPDTTTTQISKSSIKAKSDESTTMTTHLEELSTKATELEHLSTIVTETEASIVTDTEKSSTTLKEMEQPSTMVKKPEYFSSTVEEIEQSSTITTNEDSGTAVTEIGKSSTLATELEYSSTTLTERVESSTIVTGTDDSTRITAIEESSTATDAEKNNTTSVELKESSTVEVKMIETSTAETTVETEAPVTRKRKKRRSTKDDFFLTKPMLRRSTLGRPLVFMDG